MGEIGLFLKMFSVQHNMPLTSLSTGFPKAATVSHAKLWQVACFLSIAGINSDDVIYICLPLYHTTGFLGFASAIERGKHLGIYLMIW